MKISFEYDKRNWIRLIVVMVFATVMCILSHFAVWILPIFGIFYYGLKSVRIEGNKKLPWLWTLIVFISGATITMFSVQYMLMDWETFMRTSDWNLFLNVLCYLVVYFLVQACTNQTALTCAISHIALLSFGFINYFVYSFRQNEFTFADLKSVGTGLSVANHYRFKIEDRGAYVIMLTVLCIALVRNIKIEFRSHVWMRVISGIFAVGCAIFVGISSTDMNTETWEQKGSYKNGYVLNFMLGVRDSFVSAPEGYSSEGIKELEKEYNKSTSEYSLADVEKPTIIVVMSESFADLKKIGSFDTNMDVMPFWDSLYENTSKGYALSSVFGAKTPNSEWEFMTGNTMGFLPEGSVVYQQYISSQPTSVVSTLKNEGYTCVAMHPYYETGWSRNTVYPGLGFDEMHFIEDFDQTNLCREYVSDEEFYNKIIDRYESKKKNENLFIMGISMQNHGGYGEYYSNFKEECFKKGNSYTDVNQYLSLVHKTDEETRKLVEYFSKVDEPVEIVFFGDHQPGLNSAFYQMINGHGLTGLSEDEVQDLYTVPFFIWTNYETPKEYVDITSINYLSTMMLERANIDLPPYQQFLANLQQQVPAINSRGYYSKDDRGYKHIDEAKEEELEWISTYRILQYNNMFDKRHKSKVFFPYISDKKNSTSK